MATGNCGQMVAVESREPVEIELTPTEPRREPGGEERGGRRSATGGAAPVPSPRRPSPLSTERGRLLAVAGCVGLLASMIGWAAGRGSAPDGAAAIPSTTRAPATSVSGMPLPEPDDTRPPTTGPRPTARRTTTTTTTTTASPSPVVRSVEVHEALAGVPMTIVAANATGEYFELDLGVGSLTTTRLVPMFGSLQLRAGPDWVLILSQEGVGQAWLLEDGGEPVRVDVGSTWDTYWVQGSPVLWRTVFDPSSAQPIVEAIGPDGVPTGERIVLPAPFAFPQAVDPRGGVIVDLAGGSYRVTGDGVELLTTGQIFGLSTELLVTYECDAVAACGFRRVDRATGESSALELVDAGEVMPYWSDWTLSPDQSRMLVRLVSRVDSGYEEKGHGLLDLNDGTITPLATGYPPSVAWTPDGRYAIYMSYELTALDRVTGESFPVVAESLPRVDAFAVRVPAVSDD